MIRNNPMLTKKQTAVLFALADGLNGAEIADEMGVTPNTVKFHIANLRSELGAKTQAHAVAIAYHLGILVPQAVA